MIANILKHSHFHFCDMPLDSVGSTADRVKDLAAAWRWAFCLFFFFFPSSFYCFSHLIVSELQTKADVIISAVTGTEVAL